MKKLTVIIPNYNGEQYLKTCLESLNKQKYRDFETIVIDDASTDRSLESVNDYNFKALVNEENIGFAGSVNRGIKEAKTPYVLLLNNDVELRDPEFLGIMVETIESDESIFSVSPKMIRYNEPELIDDTGDEYTLFGWVYKRGDGDSILDYTQRDNVFSSCAGAGIYRRELLEQFGNFDINHFAYLEDVDLGWKALIYGYRNVYQPRAKCWHIGSATLAKGNKYSKKKVYYSARNNIYIIYKNMPFLQFSLNSPFLILGFLVKLIYFTWLDYGDEYINGIFEGLKTMKNLKQTDFEFKNLKNYFYIQQKMTQSTYQYVSGKLVKLWDKVKNKLGKKETKQIETK